MKENNIEKLQERLETLHVTQDARLACNADDLDIREEIAEVEEEIKELQDNINVDRKNSIEEDIEIIKYNMKIIRNVMNNFEDELCENMQMKTDEVNKAIEHILSDYKRVLKENKQLNKKVDLMENYMVENGYEICFDHIYEELYNCNGMERDWCRGDELEKQDIHKYFSKKLLESEK